MKKHYVLIIISLFSFPLIGLSQNSRDSLTQLLTLRQCVEFALRNQPAVRQATIDEDINERDIRISLSAWLPQINSTASYQRYLQRTTSVAGGTGTGNNGAGTGNNTGAGSGTGAGNNPGNGAGTNPGTIPSTGSQQSVLALANNVSSIGAQASQVIYNNDVNLASRASKYSRQYYKQNTLSTQIDVVSDVSKAFFDVLLSQRQLEIINEDISRLQRNQKDALSRYQAGVVDKTDYRQATIALNNSLASRKQLQEAVNSRISYLKQVMGYFPQRPLQLSYDSTRYETEAVIDTNQALDVNNRIEYRLLETQKSLQNLNVTYYKYGFLPSLSAVGSYNMLYFNEKFSNLYRDAFPTSFVGLSLNIPIFQGTRRLQNLSKARLQVKRADLDLINTRNAINTEYTQALASYKSNYTNWQFLKQNVELAKDVYNVVSLQYREGIKTYLDLIVAQTDLRTAQLNYYNALFQLLSSKIDLQRSLGTLPVR
ncbi:TolC family protein [Mucilaginibacter sp. Bleaf8]|uniref:TolC family protein n=1 Tax=Mucilaginibacter sp. Bleaf8 TaxID=2834430 RepID=UPI001BCB78A2|nr:TolC family protein [Mucilaginibacter sp. Bleaf8]MBS7563061.1 TolC family protein [Mucilaginibacter sp. Bleaf8]